MTKTYLPDITATQNIDVLYCETCNGIPFDRYKLMTTTEEPSSLRRSLALTRPMLQSTFGLDYEQVNALLCSPFFNPNHEAFDWKNRHHLRCGHEVWSVPTRPCASNCIDGSGCRGAIFPRNERQGDAILCQECVARSELVFQRYAKLEAVMGGSVDSGYVTPGPQITPEPEG